MDLLEASDSSVDHHTAQATAIPESPLNADDAAMIKLLQQDSRIREIIAQQGWTEQQILLHLPLLCVAYMNRAHHRLACGRTSAAEKDFLHRQAMLRSQTAYNG